MFIFCRDFYHLHKMLYKQFFSKASKIKYLNQIYTIYPSSQIRKNTFLLFLLSTHNAVVGGI